MGRVLRGMLGRINPRGQCMNSRGLSLPGSWSRYMVPTCKCRPRRDHTADGRGGSAPPLPSAVKKCNHDSKPTPSRAMGVTRLFPFFRHSRESGNPESAPPIFPRLLDPRFRGDDGLIIGTISPTALENDKKSKCVHPLARRRG